MSDVPQLAVARNSTGSLVDVPVLTAGGATDAQIAAAVAAYLKANPPAAGKDATDAQVSSSVGAYMVANPVPGMTLVSTSAIAETATVAIAAGMRTVNFAVTGVKATDKLTMTPTAALPTGYALQNIWPNGAGQVSVRLTVPALAIGANYSLPIAVFRFTPA